MKYNVTNVSSRPNPMSSSKNHKNIRQSPCLIVKSAISIQTVRINKSVIFKKYIKPLDMCESTTDKRINLSSHLDKQCQGQFKCCEGEKTFISSDLLKNQEETVHRQEGGQSIQIAI